MASWKCRCAGRVSACDRAALVWRRDSLQAREGRGEIRCGSKVEAHGVVDDPTRAVEVEQVSQGPPALHIIAHDISARGDAAVR
jgi:hypothetical protein